MAERVHDIVSNATLRLSEFAVLYFGVNPYGWQIETYEDINDYRRTALVAANGSGKTAAIVAPAVLWWMMMFPKGRVIITSGSWRQIEDQMWPAIRAHEHHPAFCHWKWNHLRIETPDGGFTSIFSTDKPGRAEGYHKTDDAPVLYIIDEAKSVQDGIFEAADRCTINRYLYLSSPGSPSGKHYRCFHEEAKNWRKHKVTSEMCPHISKRKREEDLETYGEDHPLYKSMHMAEWAEGEELLVLKPSDLKKAIARSLAHKPGIKYMFFDFAAGRDENAVGMVDGNKVSLKEAWKEKNTVQSRRRFKVIAESEDVDDLNIYGDADGLGLPIVQQMNEEEFDINEFHGGEKAEDDKHYTNLISEVWITGAAAIKRGDFCIEELDPETFRQMTTRKLEWDDKGRLRVMSKKDMKKEGLKSPDRADAIFGAIWAKTYGTSGVWTGEGSAPSVPDNPHAVDTVDFSEVV